MRSWRSAAIAGVWLVAAACGGDREESARADLEEETMGGEQMEPERYSDISQYDLESEQAGEIATGTAEREARELESEGETQARGAYGEMAESPMAPEPSDIAPTEGLAMQQPIEPAQPAAPPAAICPADLEGLNVRVSTIPRGGALVFTASTEQVEELRERLNRFAEMHRQQHEQMQPGATGGTGATTGEMAQGGEPGAMQHGAMQHGAMQPGATQPEGTQQQQFADTSALIHQASEVRVVDIPRGARLEIRLDDSARVRDLRAELREDATMLREGRCPLALQLETT